MIILNFILHTAAHINFIYIIITVNHQKFWITLMSIFRIYHIIICYWIKYHKVNTYINTTNEWYQERPNNYRCPTHDITKSKKYNSKKFFLFQSQVEWWRGYYKQNIKFHNLKILFFFSFFSFKNNKVLFLLHSNQNLSYNIMPLVKTGFKSLEVKRKEVENLILDLK